jgi:hypothetical protein
LYPFFIKGEEPGPGPGREKIGEITGSITFTNIPAEKPRVKIQAQNTTGYWFVSSNEISLSNISGGSGTVNWTIPLYKENEFAGTIEAQFGLQIDYGASGYYIEIDGTKQINGLKDDVGNIGSFSLATVTLSGTINVSFAEKTVPLVDIFAFTGTGQHILGGFVQLTNPGANAAWSITFLAFASPATVYLDVIGRKDYDDALFQIRQAATVTDVSNANKTGIAINLGDTLSLAEPLSVNTWANGNIVSEYGEQWFKFTATAATQYIHVTFGTLYSLNVQLYDSAGNAVGNESQLNSYSTTNASNTVTNGQVYYSALS